MAHHRSNRFEFKRQIVQETLGGDASLMPTPPCAVYLLRHTTKQA